MCGGCRPSGARIDWYSAAVGDQVADRRRARADLATAASTFFASTGLAVVTDLGMTALVVRTATGASTVVTGFADLVEVPRTRRAPVDPLDRNTIEMASRLGPTR